MSRIRSKFLPAIPWGRLWEQEKRVARKLGVFLGRLRAKLDQDEVLFLASGLAFNVLICLLPILLLWVYVVGMWSQSGDSMLVVERVLRTAFPSERYADEIRGTITAIVKGIVDNRGSLGLLSLIVLAATSASLFSSARTVLHQVFQIRTRRHFLASYLVDICLVLALTILILVTTSITWVYRVFKTLRFFLPDINEWDYHGIVGMIADFASLPVIMGLCYMLYRFVPVARPPRRTALVAAVTTSLLWEVSGRVFAFYLGSLATISKVYGAYAFILVLMAWIFYSCLIFVVGAEVAQVLRDQPPENPTDTAICGT